MGSESHLTFNWAGLALLGVSLLWARHLYLSCRDIRSGGSGALFTSILAWALILAGTLGPALVATGLFSFLYAIAAFYILAVAVYRYRQMESDAIACLLSTAIEREMPLGDSLRAYSAENRGEMGLRAGRLASLVDIGVPMANALRASRLRLPIPAQLAIGLQSTSPGIKGYQQRGNSQASEISSEFSEANGQVVYFATLIQVYALIVSFVLIKIVPTYQKIFEDFGVELPRMTQLTIAVSQQLTGVWVVLGLS